QHCSNTLYMRPHCCKILMNLFLSEWLHTDCTGELQTASLQEIVVASTTDYHGNSMFPTICIECFYARRSSRQGNFIKSIKQGEDLVILDPPLGKLPWHLILSVQLFHQPIDERLSLHRPG